MRRSARPRQWFWRSSEDGAFWTAFLRSLKARGLGGVQLVIADAHLGLRGAVEAVLTGAAVQRCRVHFVRDVLARVPKGNAEMVAAAIRTIFAQPDASHIRDQLQVIAGMLGRQFPTVETLLRDAETDLLAFADFPSPTGERSGAPTRWNGSTGRSNGAPTSSACSPTHPRCSASPAPSSSKPMTNGRSPTAATCPRARWLCSSHPPHRQRW